MGTTLACVQVYLGDRQKKAARRSVIEALRRRVLEGPYIETGRDTDPDPDREVFVGPVGAAPWLTVYDTQGDLRELARQVSAAIDGTAVLIHLVDSDVLHLRRYSRGEMVDDYCSAPHLYDGYASGPGWESDWAGKGEQELKALTRGDLARWRDLLVEGADMARLREIWDSDPIFAEDILWATADALAMDRDELDAEPGVQGGTRLTFRRREPPPHRVKAEGPPRLRLAAYVDLTEVYPGQQLDLQMYVQNDGGAATGMIVVAWGSAIDQGIVALHRALVAGWTDPGDRAEVAFAPDVGAVGEEQRAVHVASFEALELPQGIAGGLEALAQPAANWQKGYEALLQTQLVVRVQGTVERTGPGELFIGFVPLGNLHDGQAVYHASLTSLPLPRRPLRCRDAQRPVHPPALQQLERPSQLFALMALGAGREQSAQAAAEAIEAWAAKVASKKTDRLKAYLGTRPDLRPSLLRFSAAEIPASERWQELRRQFPGCVSLTLQRRGASVLYDVNALAFQASAEEPAPHLGFWFNAAAWDAAQLEAFGAWLPGLVDRLMAAGAGLQAIVGRWEWWKAQGLVRDLIPGLSVTPYEGACGVHGLHTTARFWCSRFLRGVTGQLWLGPDLIARLGGTGGLVPIATVTPVGEGVRVTLNEGATLDELEEALAPLLPGDEDLQEAMERLYPRQ